MENEQIDGMVTMHQGRGRVGRVMYGLRVQRSRVGTQGLILASTQSGVVEIHAREALIGWKKVSDGGGFHLAVEQPQLFRKLH